MKTLDKIQFKIANTPLPWDEERDFYYVEIWINGKELSKILYPIELPFAVAEDKESLAGSYLGLYPENLLYELTADKQTYTSEEDDYNKRILIDCICTCEGCRSFVADIEETENEIVWKNFEQIHRDWDYSELKEFRFDKTQYLNEIEKLKENIATNEIFN